MFAPVVCVPAMVGTDGLELGFPTTAAVLDISDIIQYLDHDKSSSISQLIKWKSRDQKLKIAQIF